MVCSIVILKNIPASLLTGYELTGLSRGGQQVSKCQEVYAKAVKLLVELASLQVNASLQECSKINVILSLFGYSFVM